MVRLRMFVLVTILAAAGLLYIGEHSDRVLGAQLHPCDVFDEELQQYCRDHELAGDDWFDEYCDYNAYIANCNCRGIQCVEEVE